MHVAVVYSFRAYQMEKKFSWICKRTKHTNVFIIDLNEEYNVIVNHYMNAVTVV